MVDKTKAALDPIHKVDDTLGLMLGGAICAGYAIGLLEARSRAQQVYPYYPPGAHVTGHAGSTERQNRFSSGRRHLRLLPDPSTGPQNGTAEAVPHYMKR